MIWKTSATYQPFGGWCLVSMARTDSILIFGQRRTYVAPGLRKAKDQMFCTSGKTGLNLCISSQINK